jgi:uncharacterized protein YqeY
MSNTVSALRSIKTAIQNEKVNGAYHELTDNDIVKLVQKLVKQRQEAMEIYSQAGRHELADNEQKEMFVLMNYLPKSLSEEELKAAIDALIDELGAQSMKDMGRVMKVLVEKYPSQYDGKTASAYIKGKLQG